MLPFRYRIKKNTDPSLSSEWRYKLEAVRVTDAVLARTEGVTPENKHDISGKIQRGELVVVEIPPASPPPPAIYGVVPDKAPVKPVTRTFNDSVLAMFRRANHARRELLHPIYDDIFVRYKGEPSPPDPPPDPPASPGEKEEEALDDTDRELQSTFAWDRLTYVAKNFTKQEFVFLLIRIFGHDIPAAAYIALHEKLRAGTIANPKHILVDSGKGGYYKNKTIWVDDDVARKAVEDEEDAWKLLAVLMHEFGHYIDHILRNELSNTGGDAHGEEGQVFAYRMSFIDFKDTDETTFARYRSKKFGYGSLTDVKVHYPEVRMAIRKYQEGGEHKLEGSADGAEHFSAGKGNVNKPGASFGHESIEDILEKADFQADELREIYFGNWLRDYSQIIFPAGLCPLAGVRNMGTSLLRKAWTRLVNRLAIERFPDLCDPKKNKTGYENFTVTMERLGVYRPREHIDNPANFLPIPPNPKAIDKDFDSWVTSPKDPLLQVDPKTSMKRYIAHSIEYMCNEINLAVAKGKTPEGRRHFGAALHVLEDYFAHSNFVELALRYFGHEVLPWTAPRDKAECPHEYPIVTGTFGPLDFIASLAEPIGNLFSIESAPAVIMQEHSAPAEEIPTPPVEQLPPGVIVGVSFSDGLGLMNSGTLSAALYEQQYGTPPTPLKRSDFLKGINVFLKEIGDMAGSGVESAWKSAFGTAEYIRHTTGNALAALVFRMGNSVAGVQTKIGDPNKDASIDPSHSQLAKDHDDHPFHVLAADLAKEAVRQVGVLMRYRWDGVDGAKPAEMARSFLRHPNDILKEPKNLVNANNPNYEELAKIVKDWIEKPENKLKGKQAHKGEIQWKDIENLPSVKDYTPKPLFRELDESPFETWNYLRRGKNYEALYGEKLNESLKSKEETKTP
jgi:hypothetical protein